MRGSTFNVQAFKLFQASTVLRGSLSAHSEATMLAILTVRDNIAAWKTHQGAGGEGRGNMGDMNATS